MHESIKRYHLTGEVKYDMLTRVRETLEKAIEDNMRDEGYVPVLDMDPHLTQSLNDSGNFNVELSIYGAYVGDKSWQVAGIMNGKTIMKHHTQKPKSPTSSQT